MILRAGDFGRQAIESELLQARREVLQMLAAEMREGKTARTFCVALRNQQDEAGHQGVVELGDCLKACSRGWNGHGDSTKPRGMALAIFIVYR